MKFFQMRINLAGELLILIVPRDSKVALIIVALWTWDFLDPVSLGPTLDKLVESSEIVLTVLFVTMIGTFYTLTQKNFHLPRTHSDHCPILFNLNPRLRRTVWPFRLESIWFSDPSLFCVVKESWSNSTNSYTNCVSDFKDRVSLWNKTTFGNIFLRKKRLAARILGVQKSLDSVSNSFLLDLEKSLINDYNGILKMEEDFWALKARINYTLDGDRNTKFFHASALSHRRRNKIFALKNSNNSWLYEEGQIKEVIVTHFKDLFISSSISENLFPQTTLTFPTIDNTLHCSFFNPPSLQEIRSVLHTFKPWKAPSPDGLHPAFFQRC